MIHTDGTPTISNAVELTYSGEEINTSLLERDGAGINVRVHYSDDTLWLLVADSDGPHVAVIPPDKVLDAFDHPYCYLP
jgi:hypothetical protein